MEQNGRILIDLDIVVFAPFLDDPYNIFHLRIRRVANHRQGILQIVLARFARYDHLKNPDTGTAFTFPIFRIGVESFQDVKRLGCVQEMTHLVTIVRDQLQQIERLVRRRHLQVQIPGGARVAVHDVTTRQPGNVHVFVLVRLVVNQQQRFLRRFVIARRGQRDAMVEIEIVVVVHVRLDGIQIHVDVFEILHEEMKRRHALSTGNGVAFLCGGAHQLETLLRHFQMVSVVRCLAQCRVHDTFENVFLWGGGI